ncbi:MAG: transporter substrate-binding domain-containing protein, partial [Oscillospiraceae bacterium]|nr:transporter substrate-binding domain-containing protein [Oscillospiraceae bacterium]
EDYAICVAKENTQLKDDINAALKELEADGVLQQLKDYYINGVEGAQPYTSPADADHSKGTLIMATNAEFPPYEYHDSMEAIVGFDVDLATAICDKLGYSLQIEDMAFDSIIAAVQTGKADFGAAGMTVNEERLKSVDFTDPICHATQVIIIRK